MPHRATTILKNIHQSKTASASEEKEEASGHLPGHLSGTSSGAQSQHVEHIGSHRREGAGPWESLWYGSWSILGSPIDGNPHSETGQNGDVGAPDQPEEPVR